MGAARECVLCDWVYDPLAKPLAVYLPGSWLPVGWSGDQPATVNPAEELAESVSGVAVVFHWAQAHHDQLASALGGGWDVDHWPRTGLG